MISANIIKLIILFGLIYLFIACVTNNEGFTDLSTFVQSSDMSNPVSLILWDDDVKYILVSFYELNDSYKQQVLNMIVNDPVYLQKEGVVNSPEGINNFKVNAKFTRTPLFVIKDVNKNKITNGNQFKVIVKTLNETEYFMKAFINGLVTDNVLQNNTEVNMMYMNTNIDSNKYLVKIGNNIINFAYLKESSIPDLYLLNDTGSKKLRQEIEI